jgi:DNA-binding NarL/FixJ family response regulator
VLGLGLGVGGLEEEPLPFGPHLIHVANHRSALEAIGPHIDLVIADLKARGRHGSELLSALRDRCSVAPVILMSGRFPHPTETAGTAFVLFRPFDPPAVGRDPSGPLIRVARRRRGLKVSRVRHGPRTYRRRRSNGADGPRALETRAPDLAITELYLDDIVGIELLQAVRRRWARRPIIVSASREHHTYLHVARMAVVRGASGFIEKPPNQSGVAALVEGLVA